MNPNILQVNISSPKQDFYIGPASSVSSINTQGKFDILAHHANFLTFIKDQPIIIRIPGQKPMTFKFPFAIIYTSNNKVQVFTDIQISLKV